MLEKQQNMLTNRGAYLVIIGVVMIAFGGLTYGDIDNQFTSALSIGMMIGGGVLSGMIFGLLYHAEGIGKSLIKPIQQ